MNEKDKNKNKKRNSNQKIRFIIYLSLPRKRCEILAASIQYATASFACMQTYSFVCLFVSQQVLQKFLRRLPSQSLLLDGGRLLNFQFFKQCLLNNIFREKRINSLSIILDCFTQSLFPFSTKLL